MDFTGGFILGFLTGVIMTVVVSVRYLPKIATWYLKRKTKQAMNNMTSIFSQLNKEEYNGSKKNEQEESNTKD